MYLFNIYILLIIIIKTAYSFYNNTEEDWLTSNFGSSYAGQTEVLFDINRDGRKDIVALSVDGEVNIYDFQNGKSINFDNWPIYIKQEHFISSPIIFVHGGQLNLISIILVSVKGSIITIDSNGYLIDTFKISNLYLDPNWKSNRKEINKYIHESPVASNFVKLQPNIYTDCIIKDVIKLGNLSDLIIGINYISNISEDYNNVIVSSLAVYNLHSKKFVTRFHINISLKSTEHPDYLLNNFHVADQETIQITMTLSAGSIYQVQWDRIHQKFELLGNSPLIIYNPGPNQCYPTPICLKSVNKTLSVISDGLCCIYSDYSGHLALFHLSNQSTILWEYNFNRNQPNLPIDVATEPTFMSSKKWVGITEPVVIFATKHGWIHCISLVTGNRLPHFPVQVEYSRFSSQPVVVANDKQQLFIIALSDEGLLYNLPFHNSHQVTVLFNNVDMASYMRPVLIERDDFPYLQSLIYTKTGNIFRNNMNPFQLKVDAVEVLGRGLFSETEMGTIYSHSSVITVYMKIVNPYVKYINTTHKYDYIIKVFINEILYSKIYCPIVNRETTTCFLLIELNRPLPVTNPNPMASDFLFGIVQLVIWDPISKQNIQASSQHKFYLRNNYDFQYELIWNVWLIFFIFIFVIVVGYLHVLRQQRLCIPI